MSRVKSNRRRGRPAQSGAFYLVPVRHAAPNPRKLGGRSWRSPFIVPNRSETENTERRDQRWDAVDVPDWVWRQIWWPQTFTPASALELLDRVSADRELGAVALKLTLIAGLISYFVGVHPHHIQSLSILITSLCARCSSHELRWRRDRTPHFGSPQVSHPSLALTLIV